jgi:Predicted SAM-dependent methyltransferases
MLPSVVISARGEERLRSGHPWIYRTDVADARASAGDIVQVRSPRGQMLGSALFSDRSQITLRMLMYGERVADEALVVRRITTPSPFANRCPSTPRRTGSSMAKPTCCRL